LRNKVWAIWNTLSDSHHDSSLAAKLSLAMGEIGDVIHPTERERERERESLFNLSFCLYDV
jgi:hypothetical protein